jgi:hypothetical protein
MNNTEKSLRLEIIRLNSICRVAAQELESLHDLLEENDINQVKPEKLINACKNQIHADYTNEFLDLQYEVNDILKD